MNIFDTDYSAIEARILAQLGSAPIDDTPDLDKNDKDDYIEQRRRLAKAYGMGERRLAELERRENHYRGEVSPTGRITGTG